jgi:hypothetical protein
MQRTKQQRSPCLFARRSAGSTTPGRLRKLSRCLDERVARALEGDAHGRSQVLDDAGIAIGDQVHVIDAMFARIVHVVFGFATGEKAPAAIARAARRFAHHETHGLAVDHDFIARAATPETGGKGLELFGG